MIIKWLIVLCSSDVSNNVSESVKGDKGTVSGKLIIIINDGTVVCNLISHTCG